MIGGVHTHTHILLSYVCVLVLSSKLVYVFVGLIHYVFGVLFLTLNLYFWFKV